jgi:hypothetical protein
MDARSGIDIRVIVFERSEDQLIRVVVEELRALIEESGVVFVAFDDELFAAAKPVAAVAEIGSHAADEKIGSPPGDLKDPRKHGRRGRLTVRAGDNDRCVAGDK